MKKWQVFYVHQPSLQLVFCLYIAMPMDSAENKTDALTLAFNFDTC